jgi:hypothetical protein
LGRRNERRLRWRRRRRRRRRRIHHSNGDVFYRRKHELSYAPPSTTVTATVQCHCHTGVVECYSSVSLLFVKIMNLLFILLLCLDVKEERNTEEKK